MFVRLFGNGEDAVSAEGELRAARLSQDLGDGFPGEEFGPGVGDHGLFKFLPVRLDLGRVDPFGTPGHPVAAQVHVAVAEDAF